MPHNDDVKKQFEQFFGSTVIVTIEPNSRVSMSQMDFMKIENRLSLLQEQLVIWKHSSQQNAEIVDHKTGTINKLQRLLQELLYESMKEKEV